MLIAALFKNKQKVKTLMCPSTDEWKKNMVPTQWGIFQP